MVSSLLLPSIAAAVALSQSPSFDEHLERARQLLEADAVAEAIEFGERTGVHVQIVHIKLSGTAAGGGLSAPAALGGKVGRAHVATPGTMASRRPSSA